jgi:hypothetical protein
MTTPEATSAMETSDAVLVAHSLNGDRDAFGQTVTLRPLPQKKNWEFLGVSRATHYHRSRPNSAQNPALIVAHIWSLGQHEQQIEIPVCTKDT